MDDNTNAVLLGQTTLLTQDFHPKYIHIGHCSAQKGMRVSAIQAQSLGDEVTIDELNLHYGDGIWEHINVNAQIPRGKVTSWLDLKTRRCIEDIEVVARTKAGAYSLAKIWAQ
jgi:hypothetical protein